MAARLNPYLTFRDNAREAMEFYTSVLGGDLRIMTFGDMGMEPANGVMHAMLETPLGFALMASDAPEPMSHKPGDNVSLSISGDLANADDLRGYFSALAEGGEITMPMEVQMWGDEYGMLTDKFGIPWMVNIALAPAQG